MVSKLSDWSGATKRTRQGCPQGERGGANQNGSPLLHSSFSLLTSRAKGEGEIRQKLVESDLVDCMIALPGQLFYTTQIPVCLWFLTKNKSGNDKAPALSSSNKESNAAGATFSQHRNREGETLFIDARKIGSMISRTQKELSTEDIAHIADTYHSWRSGACANDELSMMSDELKTQHSELSTHHSLAAYGDIPGYCKSATIDEIKKHDFVLTPGRYVGAAALEDDGIPFETKMAELSSTLFSQMKESAALDKVIRQNLKGLGYEE